MTDIVDRIAELVDEQLAGGEPRTGYDYGDPTFPRCGHCDRHWHGLPITAKIAQMYAWGEFDEDYRADNDDSRVLCRGSDFIGPMPAEYAPATARYGTWAGREVRWTVHLGEWQRPPWVADAYRLAQDYTTDMIAFVCGYGEAPQLRVERYRTETVFRFRGSGARGEPFNFDIQRFFDAIHSTCSVCNLTIWPHQTKSHRYRYLPGCTMSEAIHSHCAPALPAGRTRSES